MVPFRLPNCPEDNCPFPVYPGKTKCDGHEPGPPRRYDQCDETCTVDCGHCKGQGPPKNFVVGQQGRSQLLLLCQHEDEVRNCITTTIVESIPVRLRTCDSCYHRLYDRQEQIHVVTADGEVVGVSLGDQPDAMTSYSITTYEV